MSNFRGTQKIRGICSGTACQMSCHERTHNSSEGSHAQRDDMINTTQGTVVASMPTIEHQAQSADAG